MRLRTLTLLSTVLVGLSAPGFAQLDNWFVGSDAIDWAEEVSFSFAGPTTAGNLTSSPDTVLGVAVAYSLGTGLPDAMAPTVLEIEPVVQTSFIIFFDWDSAALSAEANQVLDDVVLVASHTGAASLLIDGYNDVAGTQNYNLGLSERRANAATDGLIARGITPDEIVIRAFHDDFQTAPQQDGIGQSRGRRVEIIVS